MPDEPAASDAPPTKRPCWENAKPSSYAHLDPASNAPITPQHDAQHSGNPQQPDSQQATGNVRQGSSDDNTAKPKPLSPAPLDRVECGGSGVDLGRIQGLGEIPKGWPKLPANAALGAEVSWVQANRLAVVHERANGGIAVHLSRAADPAPSRAALGWLETSIRSYAKWVEVAARASGQEADDQVATKRERARIEDIRAVLAEMLEERADQERR